MPEALFGFFSYSRRDDEVHGRQLSAIREFLATEIATRSGGPVEIFQDVEAVEKGPPWEGQLARALDGSDILIPIVSPAFLASEYCREELTEFVRAKEAQGRVPLVYPLYYVASDRLDGRDQPDDVVALLRRFQITDIRRFRVLPRTQELDDIEPELATCLELLCIDIVSTASPATGGLSVPPPLEAPAERLQYEIEVRASDSDGLHRALVEVDRQLKVHGFGERDRGETSTVVRELCENVARHVAPDAELSLTLRGSAGDRPRSHTGFQLTVADGGPGFDLDAALDRADAELAGGGFGHGLLRAFRLGSGLWNEVEPAHRVGWFREQSPYIGLTALSPEHVVPIVFSWAHEAIRINDHVVTFRQWEQYRPYGRGGRPSPPGRSDAFMDLVFDPLLRPGLPIVGVEIVGHGWTWALPCTHVLTALQDFIARSAPDLTDAVVYADADAAEQRSLRQFCRTAGWTFLESIERARAWTPEQ